MFLLCGMAGATMGCSACGACARDTGQGPSLPREERRAELAGAAGTCWWSLQSHLKGLVSQRPASGTLVIAQVPVMPRDEVPRGTTAPRATTSSVGQVPTTHGDTRAPSAPLGLSWCGWFPAATLLHLDGSARRMRPQGLSSSSPGTISEQGSSCTPRSGLLCGCWCLAGRAAA